MGARTLYTLKHAAPRVHSNQLELHMQHELTPSFINSLAALVIAMDHNPVGAAYLVTLVVLVLTHRSHNRK